MKKFPIYYQFDIKDCGPACLQMISKYYNKYIDLQHLRELCDVSVDGCTVYDIIKASETLGYRTHNYQTSYKRLLNEAPLPAIVHWRGSHFVVVYKISKKYVYVADPAVGRIKYSKSEFVKGWLGHIKEKNSWRKGIVILLEPTGTFYKVNNRSKSFYTVFFNLVKYLKPYKAKVIQLIFIMFIISLISTIFPFITQLIIDTGIVTKDIGLIKLLIIASLILVASTSIGNWVRQEINLHVASRIKLNLLTDYLVKVLKLPLQFFENKLMGDIIQRTYDHERLQRFILDSAFSVILSFFYLLVFGTILLIYNWKLFLIFLIGSVIYVIWVLVFWAIRKKMDIKYFHYMAQNNSFWIESLSNMQDIKNFGYHFGSKFKWEKVQVSLYKVGIKLLKVNQIQTLGSKLINAFSDMLLLYVSVTSVINGNMSLGMLFAVQYIIGQLNGPLNEIIKFITSSQLAYISYLRMSEVQNIQDESIENNVDNLVDFNNDIRISNVSFKYRQNDPPVLKNISLIIPKGKVTAIVGESGSGKSTLIKLLLRLYNPGYGEIMIGNQNIKNVSVEKWRNNISAITQDSKLFNETILNNIILDNDLDKEKLSKSLELASFKNEVERLNNSYNTMLNENNIGLSAGQKQRLLLARAFYKESQTLILDEATNALDSFNETKILENIKENLNGKTIIVSTHKLQTIKNADLIIVLKDGMVCEMGKHNDLMKIKKEYFNLLVNQMKFHNAIVS